MEFSSFCHVFLITWIQFIVVLLQTVAIETDSNDGITNNTNIDRFGNNSDYNDTLHSFVSVLDIPCPPPEQLHLVCNTSFGLEPITCDERLSIFERCLNRFPGIYNNSIWDACLMDDNKCDVIVKYLAAKGFVNSDSSYTTVSISVTSSALVTSETVSRDHNITSNVLDITSESTTLSKHSTASESTDVTESTNPSISSTTMGEDAVDGLSDHSLSVVYPVVGSIFILCEIAVLCTLFCYKKRKQKTAAQGSLVQQEEVIVPESSSPTKTALRNNYDEDSVKTEDEKIYKSYTNLKYIDESNESTPEKIALRT